MCILPIDVLLLLHCQNLTNLLLRGLQHHLADPNSSLHQVIPLVMTFLNSLKHFHNHLCCSLVLEQVGCLRMVVVHWTDFSAYHSIKMIRVEAVLVI